MSTPADLLFEAQNKLFIAESYIAEELDKVFGEDWPFDDFETDPETRSISLKNFELEFLPTDEQLKSVLNLGFEKGWLIGKDFELFFAPGFKKELFKYFKE